MENSKLTGKKNTLISLSGKEPSFGSRRNTEGNGEQTTQMRRTFEKKEIIKLPILAGNYHTY